MYIYDHFPAMQLIMQNQEKKYYVCQFQILGDLLR